MAILVTGGAGYIGSHTVLALLESGFDVIVVDNLSNSSIKALKRVEKIANKNICFYEGDILDKPFLSNVFRNHDIKCIIHFAGLKAVGESIIKPIEYYKNNVAGTLVLLEVMKENSVKKIIFSSSATVYGSPKNIPITEKDAVGGTTNPYGTSKLMTEQLLQDVAKSDSKASIIALRYFNPVGAHSSGMIGEDPRGVPCNLTPYITQVAIGKLEYLSIFGSDYPTNDGTGIRDYIHVVDLAQGHLAALNKIDCFNGMKVYNLGTGRAHSVLDVVKVFEKISGKKISYKLCSKREGDIAECWADISLAKKELKWNAIYELEDMLRDAWLWQRKNPEGYA